MYHQWCQVGVKATSLEMRVREQDILLRASSAGKLAMCRDFPSGSEASICQQSAVPEWKIVRVSVL